MSSLEDAASEHARRQRQAAEPAAVNYAQSQRAREQQAALLRERAREFFDFARDHAAPTFPLYLEGSMEHPGMYRVDEPCVTAAAWDRGVFAGRYTPGQWAVSSDGNVYYYARIEQRRRFRDAQHYGIRDKVFVRIDMRNHELHQITCERMNAHFVAAAAALLNAVPVARVPETLTGIQNDGLIGYVL